MNSEGDNENSKIMLNNNSDMDARDRGTVRERFCKAILPRYSGKQFVKKLVGKRLPFTKWVRSYDKSKLYYDFVAGITVGLMLVPQSLAYSSLAGMSPEYGLYSSYWSVFLYCILGTSKDIQIGPVALVSMLVNKYTRDGRDNAVHATTMSLFSGVILLLMSMFKLEFLIDFISVPVLTGFTSAAAIKIGTSQLKGMFGISVPRSGFFHTIYNNFSNIEHARVGDCLLGFSCLAIFIALRRLGRWNSKRSTENCSRKKRIGKTVIWFVCTARFTLAVLITTVMAQILYVCFDKGNVFVLAGEMRSGLPSPKLPIRDVVVNANTTISSMEIIREIGSGLVLTPLIAFLESIAVAKTLARKSNYKVDVTQELFALGTVNIVGSFFSAFPVAGSFSRSALSSQCSVKTTFGGFFTGVVVLLAASFLTPWFRYIPKATLSAMVIAAVIPLFEYHIVPMLWKLKKIDLVPMTVTFFFCFYETEVGILAGVAVSLLMFIYDSVKLRLTHTRDGGTMTVKIGAQSVFFPSAEQLISQLDKIVRKKKTKPAVLVVDFENVERVDSTSASLLKEFWVSMQRIDLEIFFRNVKGNARLVLLKAGIDLKENDNSLQVHSEDKPPQIIEAIYPEIVQI